MDMMSYLMGKNSGGGSKGVKIEVVTELPETGEANVIYLVPKETEDENNVFDEYLYINDEWELIGSTAIDISGKQDTMQFSTMPTADSTTVGKIIQYVGATNANYTNGYFYIGTTDGENTPTYGWSNVEVQDAANLKKYNKSVLCLDSFSISLDRNGSFTIDDNDLKTQLVEWLNDNIGNSVTLILGNNSSQLRTMYFFGNVPAYTQYPSIQFKANYFHLGQTSQVYCGYKQCIIYYNTTTGKVSNLTSGSNTWGGQIITATNTIAYTPTGDYNPAHKKYVDDSIAAAITTTLGGSF